MPQQSEQPEEKGVTQSRPHPLSQSTLTMRVEVVAVNVVIDVRFLFSRFRREEFSKHALARCPDRSFPKPGEREDNRSPC